MKKTLIPMFFDEENNFFLDFPSKSGLSLYEKENYLYVEADLPGLDAHEIEISLEEDILSIQGEKKEEEKDQKIKYHKKSHRSYSYRVSLPPNVDKSQEPQASFQKGILQVKFAKGQRGNAKKIPIT